MLRVIAIIGGMLFASAFATAEQPRYPEREQYCRHNPYSDACRHPDRHREHGWMMRHHLHLR
jgi:hypothetical protein